MTGFVAFSAGFLNFFVIFITWLIWIWSTINNMNIFYHSMLIAPEPSLTIKYVIVVNIYRLWFLFTSISMRLYIAISLSIVQIMRIDNKTIPHFHMYETNAEGPLVKLFLEFHKFVKFTFTKSSNYFYHSIVQHLHRWDG